MTKNKLIGILGGSGLDKLKIAKNVRSRKVKTPYGTTSDVLTFGTIEKSNFVVIPRHGRNHTITPTNVPYKANIWALKEVGCTAILATTACGSLVNKMKPGDFVFVDQFIDFTKLRDLTYFNKKVVHTQMAYPFDEKLRKLLVRTASRIKLPYLEGGTIVTIEGPRFSTRAESFMFKKMGAELINMSTVPEVILANEIGIPYQSIAMVTDYDCWKENEEPVSYELVMDRVKQNSDRVKMLLIEVLKDF